ncbi:hypothetical protein GcM1_208029 [Golovinomyces cichoracearum]|uniref:Uncharacterized protein n=1 Tax=Golovinomyces cichoracearum TaxID=62708 RepID=A0A420IW58_9PEZI|nr:hypothetical protein GcM1_208029 [Golovinomyces cichoracearum]
MINLSENKASQIISSSLPIALSTPSAFPNGKIAHSLFKKSSSPHSFENVKNPLSLVNYQKDSLPQFVGLSSPDTVRLESSKYIQSNSKIQKNPTLSSALSGEHSPSQISLDSGIKESKSQEYHQNMLIKFGSQFADISHVNDQVEKLMEVSINQKKSSSQHEHVNINGSDSLVMYTLQERGSNTAIKDVSSRDEDHTLKSQLHTRKLICQNRKRSTLIPIFSLVKGRSLRGNKRSDNTSNFQNYDYSCDSKLAKKFGKDFSKGSNVYYNLRFRYTKSSTSYLKNKKTASNDDCFSKSTNGVDLPSSFTTKISESHEGYSTKNTSKSELLRQSDPLSSILCTSYGSIESEASEVQNQNKSHKRITPKHKSNNFHSWYHINNCYVSRQILHVSDPIPSTRLKYQSQIPKSCHSYGKQLYCSISYTDLLSSPCTDSQAVEKKSSSNRRAEGTRFLGKKVSLSRSLLTGNNRQIHSKQSNSFWCGRFTALRDRFHNDMLEALVIDRKTFSRFQDGTRPPESSGSTVGLNNFIEITTGLQYLNDEETRRCKKSFIHLGALCVTDEAKKSLWNFQLAYARFHGIRQLLPGGGEMKTGIPYKPL